jgi:hypothetical protein
MTVVKTRFVLAMQVPAKKVRRQKICTFFHRQRVVLIDQQPPMHRDAAQSLEAINMRIQVN